MIRSAIALCLMTAPALAQQTVTVSACGDSTRVDTIAEPWQDNTATYANGDIRVALLDMVEPAGGPFKLLVISAPYDELGLRQCRVVELGDGLGFYAIDFSAHTTDYDTTNGLTITVPVRLPPEGNVQSEDVRSHLHVFINQQTGEITTQGLN